MTKWEIDAYVAEDIIPEGRQVCWACERGEVKMNKEGYKDPTAEIAVHRSQPDAKIHLEYL